MINVLLKEKNSHGNWGTPLNTALAISSLLNLRADLHEVEKGITYLLSKQKNGGWEAGSFFIDSPLQDKKRYAGSEALTTAYCLNALELYRQQIKKDTISLSSRSNSYADLQKQVMMTVEKTFTNFSIEMKNTFSIELQNLLNADKTTQITLLPFYFRNALKKSLQKKLGNAELITLCGANVFGWLAYTMYDNFLDDEGNPKVLPLATSAFRFLITIFTNILPEDKEFHMMVNQILQDLDEANFWEVTHCRIQMTGSTITFNEHLLPQYDNYDVLAKKSFGHALGPLAIMMKLGFKKESEELKKVLNFFKLYLIARQLNDDAHDWEKDLAKGHINPVISLLLAKWGRKKDKIMHTISLATLTSQLQEQFWYEIIVDVCNIIQNHINEAKSQIISCAIIEDKELLLSFLDPIQKAVDKTLIEREKAIQFLQTFEVS